MMDWPEYLSFRKMITPMVIPVLFWVVAVVVFLAGLATMVRTTFFGGIAMMLVGPIVVRIYWELLMQFFMMNDTLAGIRTLLKKDEPIPPSSTA